MKLKLNNISTTPKMVKKVIKNFDSSKTSGPDCIPVVVVLISGTLLTGAGSGLLTSVMGKLTWFHLTSLITLVLLMWKRMFVFEEKSSFKMLGLTFSYKLGWGSYIISIAKTASKKTGALICSMKFLSPEVALYLCKSYSRAWNTIAVPMLVLLFTTWNVR